MAIESHHAQRAETAGYVPIEDYAAIGDGRTVALVSRDGSVDWLCLPDLDSPSLFGALLDAQRGGRFVLAPDALFESHRRYVPGTNVLETTFQTGEGSVRVTHAMALPGGGLEPSRELICAVEGIAGEVPMAWSVEPRFGYGGARVRLGRRAGVPVASAGADALAIGSWDAGDADMRDGSIDGSFRTRPGSRALLTLSAANQEPLVLPARRDVETRLAATFAFWQRWVDGLSYQGPWRDAVVRSALALKLLVHAPTGAVAAAATTSLPETVGGERNWDYRYCWVRDAAFTLHALLALGCSSEAEAFFWWLMHSTQLTHPRLQVLYRLDGGPRAPERTIALDGYEGSTPVRIGNGAVDQLQLDIYGDLFQMVWMYVDAGGTIDADIARRLAETADLVCRIWRQPDAGLWEVRSGPQHFTQSKMMCASALDRAVRLAERGVISGKGLGRWRAEAAAVRQFVDTRCWSKTKNSYVRFSGTDELDASLLLGCLLNFADARDDRMLSTVSSIAQELSRGPFVYRYTGQDGLAGDEGAFLTCSFWLADALARCGRREEAARLFEELLGLANDVGLYAEEIDPVSGMFLGNFPQGLAHLALISTSIALGEE